MRFVCTRAYYKMPSCANAEGVAGYLAIIKGGRD